MCSIFILEYALPAHCIMVYRKLLGFLWREIEKMSFLSILFGRQLKDQFLLCLNPRGEDTKIGEAMSKGDYANFLSVCLLSIYSSLFSV